MICGLCRADSSHDVTHWDLFCGQCGGGMCMHNESIWSGYCSKPRCESTAATRARRNKRKEIRRQAVQLGMARAVQRKSQDAEGVKLA